MEKVDTPGEGMPEMVTRVEEPVDVSAIFQEGRVRPVAFRWRGRKYAVRRCLGSYRFPRGRYVEIYFSVMSEGPDVYELRFSTRDMGWTLVKVHCPG
jgi:hypothetical protein